LARVGHGIVTTNISQEFLPLIKIYDQGKIIEFKDYVKKFKNLSLVKLGDDRDVLEIRKGKLGMNLQLEASINTNHLDTSWFGTQAIYSVKH